MATTQRPREHHPPDTRKEIHRPNHAGSRLDKILRTQQLTVSQYAYCTGYYPLRERASKMNYVAYRRLRLPIGSGVTETACKILFTQRFKQSEMKSKVDSSTSILMLRTISRSRICEQVRQETLKCSKNSRTPNSNHTRNTKRPRIPKHNDIGRDHTPAGPI
jgi:hypothetical protein